MNSTSNDQDLFKVWATDGMVYGPVDLPVLIQWVREGRVQGDTWVHSPSDNAWQQAREVGLLTEHFDQTDVGNALIERLQADDAAVEELRQFSVFAGLSNEELDQFIHFGEICLAQPGELIIKRGDPGDSLFFLLSGEVRARLLVGLQDTTLGQIRAGEFFGEMAMFRQAARSADVVAQTESRLLQMTAQAFQQLIQQSPQVAAPVLYDIAKVMAHRISEDNRRIQRETAAEFVWR